MKAARLGRRLGLLLGPLAAAWLACWLLPGLLLGRPTALLDGSAPAAWKHAYVAMLYFALLGTTARAWREEGPASPALGLPRPSEVLVGFALGVAGAVLHRSLLAAGGWWAPPDLDARKVLEVLAVAPLLALAEELLFRGYLFGVFREELGRPRAYLAANLVFAGAHLLRPGDGTFKLAYGVGLFLVGAVLCRLVEASGRLGPSVGLHAGWIALVVLDPPGRVTPGWLPGLAGDPSAGLVGWALLLGFLAGAGPLGRLLGAGEGSAQVAP